MTCIVGIKGYDGRVYVGGDSAATDEDMALTVRQDPKVFQVGPYLIGTSGSFRVAQLIRYSLKVPPLPRDPGRFHRMMVKGFVGAILRCLEAGGVTLKDGAVDGSSFVVGFRGNLFFIDQDMNVADPGPYCAAGCADQIAHGALYAQRPGMDPEERVLQALKAAERFSGGVRAPFVVLSV